MPAMPLDNQSHVGMTHRYGAAGRLDAVAGAVESSGVGYAEKGHTVCDGPAVLLVLHLQTNNVIAGVAELMCLAAVPGRVATEESFRLTLLGCAGMSSTTSAAQSKSVAGPCMTHRCARDRCSDGGNRWGRRRRQRRRSRQCGPTLERHSGRLSTLERHALWSTLQRHAHSSQGGGTSSQGLSGWGRCRAGCWCLGCRCRWRRGRLLGRRRGSFLSCNIGNPPCLWQE
jgi:hypothetical protein